MRVAIIAGLIAVGLLMGCGGTELAPGSETGTSDVHAAEWCHRCDMSYDYCMEFASTYEEKTQCGIERTECYEAGQCPTRHGLADEGGPDSSNAAQRQVRESGLPPDNICHVWCDVGPRAGHRTSAYAGSLEDCFAFARDECGEAGTYTYNGQPVAF
ncbi:MULTISPECIES: hypothetical protein [unclassified Corallococcus]|uniref:hypothetical protein n=1 Tax=unclassified Corallococcus TaxID=2685029 RepID=UPI001A8FCDA7|nr:MULTISPECIES: hypothetical protein [unclassified Corallococcus]MBN9685168.1 hypothetical protein [Corallococcus sp. NCSPR001]WAS83374.1 hypothetical protein O0N60_29175 [Corallococcus sp. NCRR]